MIKNHPHLVKEKDTQDHPFTLCKWKGKKDQVEILITDKIDFKAKVILGSKENTT